MNVILHAILSNVVLHAGKKLWWSLNFWIFSLKLLNDKYMPFRSVFSLILSSFYMQVKSCGGAKTS